MALVTIVTIEPMVQAGAEPVPFLVGERVIVTGGYDQNPVWLRGGVGYSGTLVEIAGTRAIVQLDDELVLEAPAGRGDWADFGQGNAKQCGTLHVARGQWLVLMQGWVGGEWCEPTGRLHVGLCSFRPALDEIPHGGGVGAWVESHAGMRHQEPA